MIKFLVAAAMAITLAACSAPDTLKPVRASEGKVALPPAPPPPPMPDDQIVCPADVKLCADGSYVSRDAAQGCAFKPCPGATQP